MPSGWRDLGPDPNAPQVLAHRRAELTSAWCASPPSREEFIISRAEGLKVLDIGCVDHVPGATTAWPSALHGLVRAAARECVGVDFEPVGVAAMRAGGFDVVLADVTKPAPQSLLDRAPFDLVVAGETIEHLTDPLALLVFARDLLHPGGTLVATTPNPYAPWRVRAGQLRLSYESVDHVTYLFPAGMVEIASRAGMRLVEATSTGYPTFGESCYELARAVWRKASGRTPRPASVPRHSLPLPDVYVWPWEWVALSRRARKGWLGETAIYVMGPI